MPAPGYYSLIQFCPDRGRLEAVNVGVVVLCPALNFLDARIAPSDDRVARFFGRASFDAWALESGKRGIAYRIRAERDHLIKPEALQHFIDTRANDFVMTPLRHMRVEDPEADLERLYRKLVLAEPRHREPRTAHMPDLEALFIRLKTQRPALVATDYTAEIPTLDRRVNAPFAYKNGAWNLVKPERFAGTTKQATEKAMRLAVIGDQLQRHGTAADGARQNLIVVAAFPPSSNATAKDRVSEIMEDYSVRVVPAEAAVSFADEIEREVLSH